MPLPHQNWNKKWQYKNDKQNDMSKSQPCLPRVKTPPTSYISILCMRGRSGAGGKGRRRKGVSGTFIHYDFWLSETCRVPVLQRLKTIFGKPYSFEGQNATMSVRAINSWLAKRKINVWNIGVTLSIYSANLTDTRHFKCIEYRGDWAVFVKLNLKTWRCPSVGHHSFFRYRAIKSMRPKPFPVVLFAKAAISRNFEVCRMGFAENRTAAQFVHDVFKFVAFKFRGKDAEHRTATFGNNKKSLYGRNKANWGETSRVLKTSLKTISMYNVSAAWSCWPPRCVLHDISSAPPPSQFPPAPFQISPPSKFRNYKSITLWGLVASHVFAKLDFSNRGFKNVMLFLKVRPENSMSMNDPWPCKIKFLVPNTYQTCIRRTPQILSKKIIQQMLFQKKEEWKCMKMYGKMPCVPFFNILFKG